MNKNLKAADDVRRLLRGFAGLAEAAEAFEQVGQLEQARDEAQAALTTLRAEIDEAHTNLARVQDATSAARQVGEDFMAQGQANAERIVTAAKSEAERIAREANAAADEMHELAKKARDAALAERDEALAKRDAAVAELAETEGKLDKARKQITKLLG